MSSLSTTLLKLFLLSLTLGLTVKFEGYFTVLLLWVACNIVSHFFLLKILYFCGFCDPQLLTFSLYLLDHLFLFFYEIQIFLLDLRAWSAHNNNTVPIKIFDSSDLGLWPQSSLLPRSLFPSHHNHPPYYFLNDPHEMQSEPVNFWLYLCFSS